MPIRELRDFYPIDLTSRLTELMREPPKPRPSGRIRPTYFKAPAWPVETANVDVAQAPVPAEEAAVKKAVAASPAPPPAGDKLINEREAMRLLNISESTIKRMRKDSALPFVKIGVGKKLVRYRLSDVQAKM